MNQISLREFQLRASLYLKELPVVLTQYNLPKYIVLTLDEYQAINPEKVSTDELKFADKPTLRSTYVEGKALAYMEASKPFVRCRAPMCRNEATETGLAFNEQTGEMDEVPLCKKHADKAAKE